MAASVPNTMFTPAFTARLKLSLCFLETWRSLFRFSSSTPFCSPKLNVYSVLYISIESQVPCFLARAMASSSKKLACSTLSTPAMMAVFMPLVPCACAATGRSRMCASSTMAFISSSEYCCTPTLVPFEKTPPVAQNFIAFAPYFIFSRTFVLTAHGPSATPVEVYFSSGGKRLLSQCPPVIPSEGPAAQIRGPTMSPALIPSRTAITL